MAVETMPTPMSGSHASLGICPGRTGLCTASAQIHHATAVALSMIAAVGAASRASSVDSESCGGRAGIRLACRQRSPARRPARTIQTA